MSNPWTFYKDERDEHRWGLGKYAGEHKYISGEQIISEWTGGADGVIYLKYPLLRYRNDKCDNINLVEDQTGLFCNYCCHYHAKFNLKGITRVYQPLRQNGYDTPPQTFINPGKYRSDWTGDDVCFEDPYDEDNEKVNIEPGDDFWYRVGLRLSKYHMKVEV